MRAAECHTPEMIGEAWAAWLKRVPDPRRRRGQRYAWETLLLVICAALVSGQQTGAAIAQWVADHAAEWQAWAPTTAGRVPSAATLRRALRLVDPRRLEAALGAWVEARLHETERPAGASQARAMAVDGKAVRGAQTHGAKIHLVSLVTHAQAVTLSQCAVEAKSNEIPAARQLLGGRDLRGWVVTLDALHTQRATAELILRQGGHYLMMVKENQPALCAALREWFMAPAWPEEREATQTTSGKGHGRLEKRTLTRRLITSCGQRTWLDWPGACQGMRRVTWAREQTRGRERQAAVYGLTSLLPEQASATELEALWRGHWAIENRAHWVRDVTCHEDAGQAWRGHTPHALAALRNGVLAAFRLAGWTNMAAAFRHTSISVSHAFRALGYSSPPPQRL